MIKVQINGDKSSMETLQKNFKNIKKENDTYFLECPQFQKQKREDVLTFAEEKLKQMVFILNLKIDDSINAKVVAAEFHNKDGTKDVIMETTTASLRINAEVSEIAITDAKTGETKIIDPRKSSENLELYLECMDKNKDVKPVLKYYSEKNPSNISSNYYKIIEVIGDDFGGKSEIPNQLNSISKKKFSDLTYTLNCSMETDSRHHTKSESVIEGKILSKNAVTQLMNNIVEEWLSIKCN